MEQAVLPQLNFSTYESQIFWLVIVFFLFFFYIKKIVSPYFFKVQENRDLYITNHQNEIRKLQKKANFLSDEYQESLQASYLKSSDIVLDAKKKMQKKINDFRYTYNAELNKKLLEDQEMLNQKHAIDDSLFVAECKDLIALAANKINISIDGSLDEEIGHLILKEKK